MVGIFYSDSVYLLCGVLQFLPEDEDLISSKDDHDVLAAVGGSATAANRLVYQHGQLA
jgi:hypothetical protein